MTAYYNGNLRTANSFTGLNQASVLLLRKTYSRTQVDRSWKQINFWLCNRTDMQALPVAGLFNQTALTLSLRPCRHKAVPHCYKRSTVTNNKNPLLFHPRNWDWTTWKPIILTRNTIYPIQLEITYRLIKRILTRCDKCFLQMTNQLSPLANIEKHWTNQSILTDLFQL